MTVFAYIRVSTEMQTVENQRDMIKSRGYHIDEWLCDEATSGTTDWKIRDIKNAVYNGLPGDRIIVAELSRLGRSLKQILEIVEECRSRQITIVMIREGIEVTDDNPFTKLLVSILGSLAEMERNLISQRTKDALALKRKQGIVLGRPVGSRSRCHKLTGKETEIKSLFRKGYTKSYAAKVLGVDRMTLDTFIKNDLTLKKVWDSSSKKIRQKNIRLIKEEAWK